MYASLIYVRFGLDNSVQYMLRQAIIQTNWDSLLNNPGASSNFVQKSPESNETSIDIKDSKFVDHLYIDWPVAK